MLASSYVSHLVFKRLPHTLQQRHTRRRQCLCQYTEEFLTAYLPCIRQEADIRNLSYVMGRYMHCEIAPSRVLYEKLGIPVVSS